MSSRVRIIFSFWVEILLGLFLLNMMDSIRWFLFYSFIIIIILITMAFKNLRQLIIAIQFINRVNALAVIRKLKISDDDLSIVMDAEKKSINTATLDKLQQELQNLN